MADVVVINLNDAPVTVEKHGRGCPRGSKNKSKIVASTSSTTLAKRRHGRPLGSNNKKPSTMAAGAAILPDVSLAQPIVPQASAASMFSFFAFASAQCREHQRLPRNLLNSWMVASFVKLSSEKSPAMGHHMNWRYTMMVKVMCSSRVVGHALLNIMIFTKGWILIFNYHCGTSKFDVKIFDGTKCQKKYAPASE
jgi:hypothetical protein